MNIKKVFLVGMCMLCSDAYALSKTDVERHEGVDVDRDNVRKADNLINMLIGAMKFESSPYFPRLATQERLDYLHTHVSKVHDQDHNNTRYKGNTCGAFLLNNGRNNDNYQEALKKIIYYKGLSVDCLALQGLKL
jgi:hypothetical protein